MNSFRKIMSIIFFALCITLSFNIYNLFGQNSGNTEYGRVETDTISIDLDTISDGPYVYRQLDSSYMVFYICDGIFESRDFPKSDTIKFTGFCHDEGDNYLIPIAQDAPGTDIIDNASKILAVSDVHGRYDLLVDILKKCNVIDQNLHWKWGDGHLVIDGDVFDRGAYVTECLWLVYRLEQEAALAGGQVHFILGNHELMVLQGDNRYVNEKYLRGIVNITAIGYQDMYGPRMELGRWLRTKSTIAKINDILFVHGGISPSLLDYKLSLTEINNAVRASIDIAPDDSVFGALAEYLFGSKGPFWYRGYFYDMENRYSKATPNEIDSTLAYFGAKKIIVGHTSMDRILPIQDDRVIAIHTPLDAPAIEALLWEDGKFYRITGEGERESLE